VLFPAIEITSPELSDQLYEWLLRAAVWHLETRPGSAVVLDARPLTRIRDVQALRRFASGLSQELHIIECVRSPRASNAPPAPKLEHDELDPDLRKRTTDLIPDPKITVDTILPLQSCVGLAIKGINAGSLPIHSEVDQEVPPLKSTREQFS
jgi:hypothetical protein